MLLGWGTGSGESTNALTGVIHSYNKEEGWGSYNKCGYSNAEFDRLSEQAAMTVDAAKREKLLIKAMDIGIGDLAIIPLYEQFTVIGTKKGVEYTPRSDEKTLAMNAKPVK